MADSNNSRTQVLIAVIGLAGVLGTAVIANYDKIFKKADATSKTTDAASLTTTPSNNAGNEGAKKGGGTKHKVPPADNSAPAPSAPHAVSLGGRIFDHDSGMPLSTARLAIEIGNQKEVEVVDSEGRYLFYLNGFAPDDLLTLNVQSPNHR